MADLQPNFHAILEVLNQVIDQPVWEKGDLRTGVVSVVERLIADLPKELGFCGACALKVRLNESTALAEVGPAPPRLSNPEVETLALAAAAGAIEAVCNGDHHAYVAVPVGGAEGLVVVFGTTSSFEPLKPVFMILKMALESCLQRLSHSGLAEEARQIQESILPRKIPSLSEYDIHASYRPMESVGGDYFSFLQVSKGTIGLAIADSSGHGFPAALLCRDVHVALRMGLNRDFRIARTVERLNQIFGEGDLRSRFVSLFYGEIESNGVLIYTNAGHPPPLLLRKGRWMNLTEGGPVLGPLPGSTYLRGVANLAHGSVLVLYTDGIIEAMNSRQEEFGKKRLKAIVEKSCSLPAAEICQQILTAIEDFLEGIRQSDDMTLIVVKRVAEPT